MSRIKRSQRTVKTANKFKSVADDIRYNANRITHKVNKESEEKEPVEYANDAVNSAVEDIAVSTKRQIKNSIKKHTNYKLIKQETKYQSIPLIKKQHTATVWQSYKLKSKPRFINKLKNKEFLNTAKNAIANTKILTATLLCIGGVAVIFTLIITMIGLLAKSPYGVFLSTEDTGTGYTLTSVIEDINNEYLQEIEKIKNSVPHDSCEVNTIEIPWKEIVAVYAVIVSSSDSYEDTIAIDTDKAELLHNIFWDFIDVSYSTSAYEEFDVVEVADETGVIYKKKISTIKTRLCITLAIKSLTEVIDIYNFDINEIYQVQEFISGNNNFWRTHIIVYN